MRVYSKRITFLTLQFSVVLCICVANFLIYLELKLFAGSIVLDDVITVLPFGEKVCVININGSVLWNALEWSVDAYEEYSGQFLQVSGKVTEAF